MKQITSVQNPFIKSLALLQEKAKARKQTGTFLIEGIREIELAIKGNYEIETILICFEVIEKSFNPSIFQSLIIKPIKNEQINPNHNSFPISVCYPSFSTKRLQHCWKNQ